MFGPPSSSFISFFPYAVACLLDQWVEDAGTSANDEGDERPRNNKLFVGIHRSQNKVK